MTSNFLAGICGHKANTGDEQQHAAPTLQHQGFAQHDKAKDSSNTHRTTNNSGDTLGGRNTQATDNKTEHFGRTHGNTSKASPQETTVIPIKVGDIALFQSDYPEQDRSENGSHKL